MTESVRDLARQAPKSGPWIIGYTVAVAAAFAASANGIVTSPQSAIPFWIMIVGCTVMMVVTSWRRHRILGSVSPAVRRFWRHFVISAAFMFLSYCLLAFGQMVGKWDEGVLRAVALLPTLGFAAMIWSVHRYPYEETDEFLRERSLRQILIASLVTLGGALLWSALAQAGVVSSGAIGLVILLWFGGLGIGRLANEMRP